MFANLASDAFRVLFERADPSYALQIVQLMAVRTEFRDIGRNRLAAMKQHRPAAFKKFRRSARRASVMQGAASPEAAYMELAAKKLLSKSECPPEWCEQHFRLCHKFVATLRTTGNLKDVGVDFLVRNINLTDPAPPPSETLLSALRDSKQLTPELGRQWYARNLRTADLLAGLRDTQLLTADVPADWYAGNLPREDLLAALKATGLLAGCTRDWLVDKLPVADVYEALRSNEMLTRDLTPDWYRKHVASKNLYSALLAAGHVTAELSVDWCVKNLPKAHRAKALLLVGHTQSMTAEEIVKNITANDARFDALLRGGHLTLVGAEWLGRNLNRTFLFRALMFAGLLTRDTAVMPLSWYKEHLSKHDFLSVRALLPPEA